MEVRINTENGQMIVDLAVFFPNKITKVRKLFKLIQAGCSSEDQQKVRKELIQLGLEADDVRRTELARIADLEECRKGLEKQLKDLKQQVETNRSQISSVRASLVRAEQIRNQSSVWVTEFERICGKGGRG